MSLSIKFINSKYRIEFPVMKWIILASLSLFSNNVYGSCVAPKIDVCAEISIEKKIGPIITWNMESCKILGSINSISNKQFITETKNKFVMFVERKSCDSISEKIILGDLIHYWGCPDGGLGMQKDPDIPGLRIKPPIQCTKEYLEEKNLEQKALREKMRNEQEIRNRIKENMNIEFFDVDPKSMLNELEPEHKMVLDSLKYSFGHWALEDSKVGEFIVKIKINKYGSRHIIPPIKQKKGNLSNNVLRSVRNLLIKKPFGVRNSKNEVNSLKIRVRYDGEEN